MKINCYYEFMPSTESTRCAWHVNFNNLPDNLKKKYPNYEFNKIQRWSGTMGHMNPFDGVQPFDKLKHSIITDTIFIIENDENKKYFVISTWDKTYWDVYCWSDLKEKCVDIFSIAGMHLNDVTYKIAPLKYTPLNLQLNIVNEEKIIDELYYENLKEDKRIIPEKLFFQSLGAYLFRNHISKDDRFDFVNATTPNIRDWLKKLNQFKINIDINCVAEPSNRIGEILGLGSVLLRPKLKHEFHNPLIPNFHYVAVEHEDYSDDEILKNYNLLADAYISTFNKIKNDDEYLRYISANGRDYFDKYLRNEKWVETLLNLIDIDKLK
jgi:hypothetical protein